MKAWKHFKTITYHKYLVCKGCFKVGLYRQGLLHDMSKYSPSEFLDARSCGFLSRNGDYAFVFTPSAVHYYKREYGNFDEYTLYHTENISEDGISIIKMAPDTEYCYLLDTKNERLYTMRSENSVSDGGLILKKGSCIDCDVKEANESLREQIMELVCKKEF